MPLHLITVERLTLNLAQMTYAEDGFITSEGKPGTEEPKALPCLWIRFTGDDEPVQLLGTARLEALRQLRYLDQTVEVMK